MYLTGQTSAVAWPPTVPRDRWAGWLPTTDILVGRRLLGRLGVKAGLGTRTFSDDSDYIVRLGCRSWLSASGEAITWAVKFMVVVPVGRTIDRQSSVAGVF